MTRMTDSISRRVFASVIGAWLVFGATAPTTGRAQEETPTDRTFELDHAFDWTVGVWDGVRRDAEDGSEEPMTMTVEAILAGSAQFRRVEVNLGDSVYRGVATQIPDRKGNRWVRQYTNGLRGTFATLIGVVESPTHSTWTTADQRAPRQSSLVSELLDDGLWRRTMSISTDGGKTWRPLWIDELRRSSGG